MSEENSVAKPEGNGLAIGGFVISLVGLIFTGMVMAIVLLNMATGGGMGLAYFWVVLCLASVIMSAMGMKKLGATGGKKGLAIAGLIIGIVATIWAIMLTMGLNTAAGVADVVGSDAMDQLNDALNDLN